MLTLGIESSCDETSCAVLRNKDELLSNIISSSLFRHKPFGGVVPEIASRHSLEQIDTVFKEALDEAGVSASDLDLIAVTKGPGLIGSLFVGVAFAKMLSYQLGIPLVGVNHLDAHLVASFIGTEVPEKYIGLLVSGGHTSISYHSNVGAQRAVPVLMGSTIDDAVGEAFDKVSKLLGLGYPGGPVIEKRAREGKPGVFNFTKPKLQKPYDFSYSGIKTAVLHKVQKEMHGSIQQGSNVGAHLPAGRQAAGFAPLRDEFINNLCRGFQDSAVAWLVEKTIKAALEKEVKHIVIGGGVSANQYLKGELEKAGSEYGIELLVPENFKLSLDNAGMIARRGIELYEIGEIADHYLTAIPSLKL